MFIIHIYVESKNDTHKKKKSTNAETAKQKVTQFPRVCCSGCRWCCWSSRLPRTKRRTRTPGTPGSRWTERSRCKCTARVLLHTHINSTNCCFFNVNVSFGPGLQGDPGVQGVKGDGGPKGEPVSSYRLQNASQLGWVWSLCTHRLGLTSLLLASG